MYTAHGQLNRDALIRQYAPLVRRIAQHMLAKLPPSVELDDLLQSLPYVLHHYAEQVLQQS